MKTIAAALLAIAALLFIACASAPDAPAAVSNQASAEASHPSAPESEPDSVEETQYASSDPEMEGLDLEQAAVANAEYAAAVLEPLAAYEGASKECLSALTTAYAQALDGEWRSAIDGLSAFDPEGLDPYALAMRIDLVLGGAIRTDMHTRFVVEDLEDGETVEILRETEGDYEFFDFVPDAYSFAMTEAGTAIPAVLHKILGDYFYEALSYFPGEWTLPDEQIVAACLENYAAAYAAGRRDEDAIGRQIELLTEYERAEETEPLLREMIALKPEDPELKLNYAQLLFEIDREAECLAALDVAVAAYGDSPDRFKSLATAARIAARLDALDAYERYMVAIDEGMPDDPTPALLRHLFAVENGWDDKADAAADGLAATRASDPQTIHTLIASWYSSDRQDAAMAFLERSIASSQDMAGTATLRFYRAVLIAEDAVAAEDWAAALAELDAAEAIFIEIEDPEAPVFGAIEQVRQGIDADSATADSATADSATADSAEGGEAEAASE